MLQFSGKGCNVSLTVEYFLLNCKNCFVALLYTQKCKEFTKRTTAANVSKEAYKIDARRQFEDDEFAMSIDLQNVIILPRLPGLKCSIFCKRLLFFNESFVHVGSKKGKGLGVIWHEALAGRSAKEIASTFINVMEYSEFRDVTKFWADNCNAQNKNWWLFSPLVKHANSNENPVKAITVDFFVPGHGFVSAADSFHAQIEKGMRHNKVCDRKNKCKIPTI